MSIEQPTIEEINSGEVNFWGLTYRDIDVAVCKALLKDNPEFFENHPKLAEKIRELK